MPCARLRVMERQKRGLYGKGGAMVLVAVGPSGLHAVVERIHLAHLGLARRFTFSPFLPARIIKKDCSALRGLGKSILYVSLSVPRECWAISSITCLRSGLGLI